MPEIGRDATLVGDDDLIEDFLSGELAVFVDSSWVDSVKFLPRELALEVSFLNGGAAKYLNVLPGEAQTFYRASSKGTWLWDNILVRGKGNKGRHRKPYTRIR